MKGPPSSLSLSWYLSVIPLPQGWFTTPLLCCHVFLLQVYIYPLSLPPIFCQPLPYSSHSSMIIFHSLSFLSSLSVSMLNHSSTILLIHYYMPRFYPLDFTLFCSAPICSAHSPLICLILSERFWNLIAPLMLRSDMHCLLGSSQLDLLQPLNFNHYLNSEL